MLKDNYVFLIAIASLNQKEELLAEIANFGGSVFNIINGYGSVKNTDIEDLEIEQNKVIITCLMREEKSVKTLESLITNFKFNQPNTGIAFTVAVEAVGE